MCHREPGQLKTGAWKDAEDGLGAAYRSISAKATTGSPVTVINCISAVDKAYAVRYM